MTACEYIFLECQRPECAFRFPAPQRSQLGYYCPKCGFPALLPQPTLQGADILPRTGPPPGPRVDLLVDNVRSAFNVGSILRTADGAGLSHVHICGISPTPENLKTAKTSLGAEFSIPWSYHLNAVKAAKSMRLDGLHLWALEGGLQAGNIFDAVQHLDDLPIGLIVGNEITGVDPALIDLCDQVVFIPMAGVKGSLNVAIAFSIAAYLLRYSPVHQKNPK